MKTKDVPEDEMREEYDFAGGVRANYAERYAEGSNVVLIGGTARARAGEPQREEVGTMSDVYKSIEVVGTSDQSFAEAARVAVRRAGETIRELEWFEVTEQRGYIRGSDIHQFQVTVKIWFKLEGGATS